jgi:hypothetical protein
MKNPLRYRFRLRDLALRDLLAVGVPAILLIAGGFWLAAQFIRPAPPNFLIMSTGAPGGAYEAFAARYRPHLAAQGIELRERVSAGAVENLKRLLDPNEEVDVAFLQGGLGVGVESETLVSLGSFYHEPLWVFYRGEETLDQLIKLRGKRLAIGGEGSGTSSWRRAACRSPTSARASCRRAGSRRSRRSRRASSTRCSWSGPPSPERCGPGSTRPACA